MRRYEMVLGVYVLLFTSLHLSSSTAGEMLQFQSNLESSPP